MTSRVILPSVAPCCRCGSQPEAMRDEHGYTAFHFCGDKLAMAANYPTLEKAIEKWEELQS